MVERTVRRESERPNDSSAEAEEVASGSRMSIRALKSTYRPGERVIVQVTNGNTADVFLDKCTGSVDNGQNNCGVSRTCAAFPAQEDVLRSMRRIPAGGSLPDTFHVNGCAAAGQWWVWLAFLDREGQLLTDGVRKSEPFQVIR